MDELNILVSIEPPSTLTYTAICESLDGSIRNFIVRKLSSPLHRTVGAELHDKVGGSLYDFTK